MASGPSDSFLYSHQGQYLYPHARQARLGCQTAFQPAQSEGRHDTPGCGGTLRSDSSCLSLRLPIRTGRTFDRSNEPPESKRRTLDLQTPMGDRIFVSELQGPWLPFRGNPYHRPRTDDKADNTARHWLCVAHKGGEMHAKTQPVLSKQFPEGSRPQYTFFRYGLDFLREVISPFRWVAERFSQCVQVLAGAEPQPVYAS